MHLDRAEIVAGLPAALAQRFVRACRNGWDATEDQLQPILDTAGHHEPAQQVAARLVEQGYLERDVEASEFGPSWSTTTKGNAMAMASFARRITRAAADTLLEGLLERAQEINTDPSAMFTVDRIRVFGSYLDPAVATLGDLDIELRFSRRVSGQEIVAYGMAARRSFSNPIEQVNWAETEFIRRLKQRSHYIQITLEDTDRLGADARTVFDR